MLFKRDAGPAGPGTPQPPSLTLDLLKRLHAAADEAGLNGTEEERFGGELKGQLKRQATKLGKKLEGKASSKLLPINREDRPGAKLREVIRRAFQQKAEADVEALAQHLERLQFFGEFAQSTYDSMLSKFIASPRYGSVVPPLTTACDRAKRGWLELGFGAGVEFTKWERHTWQSDEPLDHKSFTAYKFLYSTGGFYKISPTRCADNYAGHICYRVVEDHLEIVVSWRGTIVLCEWVQDGKAFLTRWKAGLPEATPPIVEEKYWRDLNLPYGPLGGGTALWLASLLLPILLSRSGGTLSVLWEPKDGQSGLLAVSMASSLWNHVVPESATRTILPVAAWLTDHLAAVDFEKLWSSAAAVAEQLAPFITPIVGAAQTALSLLDPLGAFQWSWAEASWLLLMLHVQIWNLLLCTGVVLAVQLTLLVLIDTGDAYRSLAKEFGALLTYVWAWGRFFSNLFVEVHERGDQPAVHYGFKQSYTSSSGGGRQVPRAAVLESIADLMLDHKDVKTVSVSTTGHSLGGALASLSAFDIADLALTSDQSYATAKAVFEQQGQSDMAAIMDKFRQATAFVRLPVNSSGNTDSPAAERMSVTAYTYAAPRVGDKNFARSFTEYENGSAFWQFAVFITLLFVLLLGATWVNYEALPYIDRFVILVTLAMYFVLISGTTWRRISKSTGTKHANPKVILKSYRVYNVRDVVPKVPGGLMSLDGFCHAGKEVQVDSVHVSVADHGIDFNALSFIFNFPSSLLRTLLRYTGRYMPAQLFNRLFNFPGMTPLLVLDVDMVGRRHNLEVYLKSLVPSRDHIMMNKSDNALLAGYKVKPCWFEPEEYGGYKRNKENVYWREAEKNHYID